MRPSQHVHSLLPIAACLLVASPALGIARLGYARVQVTGGDINAVRAYNSTGGAVTHTVADAARGRSTVVFEGLGGNDVGHVQVTAVGPDPAYCKVTRWVPSIRNLQNIEVSVACFDYSGGPRSGPHEYFVVFIGGAARGDEIGYAWASRPTATQEYSAEPRFSFNGAGGAVRVQRLELGQYRVRFDGLRSFAPTSGTFGNVQLTAYGDDNVYCTLLGSGPSSSGPPVYDVTVNCFRGSLRADTAFNVLVLLPASNIIRMVYTRGESPHASTPPHSGWGNVDHIRTYERLAPDVLRATLFEVRGRWAGGAVLMTRRLGMPGWCRPRYAIHAELPIPDFPWVLESQYEIDPLCVSPAGTETNGSYDIVAFSGTRLPVRPVARTATVRIERLIATSRDACNGRMDFFADVTIFGTTTRRVVSGVREGNDVRPNFVVSSAVPATANSVRVVIAIKDDDDAFCGGSDDIVDINPAPTAANLDFRLDFQNGLLDDQHGLGTLGEIGSTVVLEGRNGRETGRMEFSVAVSPGF